MTHPRTARPVTTDTGSKVMVQLLKEERIRNPAVAWLNACYDPADLATITGVVVRPDGTEEDVTFEASDEDDFPATPDPSIDANHETNPADVPGEGWYLAGGWVQTTAGSGFFAQENVHQVRVTITDSVSELTSPNLRDTQFRVYA